MEGLNGNVFFNVTLSFWTTPNRTRVSPSGNGGPASVSGQTSQTASHSHSVHTNPITATLNLTQTKDALKQNLSSLWRKETTDSGGSGGQPSVVNTVVSSHSGGSPIDRKQNVNLTNSLMNGNISRPNIWDTLVSDNQTQTNYSYLGALGSARVKGRFAHYSDSSIGHPVLESSRVPIVGAASNDDDYQLFDYDNVSTGSWMSSPSWNLTLTSEPSTTTTTANWTDVFYLNNQSLWKDCFDSNLLHDGCVRTVNESANLTTTGGYEQLLDEHERVYWALFLIILPILALFGNILVILSVYRERSLQTVTNWFIVSLAFADLFVTIPMLFSLYVMVNVDWELSELICDLFIASDVICSTASIFNLVAISFDRYIAVTHPIFYSKHKNDKRVIITIILVWIASASVGLPIILGANTSPERLPELCIFYNSDFIIYSSLWSFYVPCLIMVILYYKIFKAIHDRAKKKMDSTKSKAANANNSMNNSNKSMSLCKQFEGKNRNQTLENISLSKQIQMKSASAIKLEQIKVPIVDKGNHIQTSVAVISEVNIVASNENNNSNNTESHFDEEDEEDDEDLEEEQEEIEIKELKNRCSTTQINFNSNCNCSIYPANQNEDATATKEAKEDYVHISVPESVLVEKGKEVESGGEVNDSGMFTVEKASSSLKLKEETTTTGQTNQQSNGAGTGTSGSGDALGGGGGDSGSPSDSTSEKCKTRNASFPVVVAGGVGDECAKNSETATNENDSFSIKYLKKKSRFNLGRKHKSSRKKREKASAKRERKATKTLAIVLGVFLLCWTPFFSCNILDAICIKLHENHFIQSDCRPGMTAFLLTTWLGYMNSCANPLIYTIFNPEFRKAFRKILFRK